MIKSDLLKATLIGLGMVAIQIILLRHLTIFDAESDLVLLFIIWACRNNSKTECLILAATLGFTQDALTDFWGINMFAKVLTVFIVHGFLNRTSGNRFLLWQIYLMIFVIAFIHNSFFFVVSTFSELYASDFVIWSLLLVSSLFTALVGSFLQLVRVDN